jgi:hypothetical protein
MSYRDDKVEETRRSGESGAARRPLKTFLRGPGYEFRVLESSRGKAPVPTLISYREADERTFWRRVEGVEGDWFEMLPERTERKLAGAQEV